MNHLTPLKTGSRFLRQRLGHGNRKRFVIATLLSVVVGVQLVRLGRLTMSVTFVVEAADIASVSAADSTTTSFTATHNSDFVQTTNKTLTELPHLFDMTADSASAAEKKIFIFHDRGGSGFLFNVTVDDDSEARRALRMVGNRTCFVEGLDEKKRGGQVTADDGCPCKVDWFGSACSLPGFISRSSTSWSKDALRLRSQPRRVIYAFPFNVEFDMLELRLAELADVVDVFLILESNYTRRGTLKPLRLLERLRNETFLQNVAAKVVHIFLNHFPAKARKDGRVAEALYLNYLGTHGLRRLGGLKADDLLVLTDADELPRRQLLSFLRWHDGYSEPVVLNYRWSVYGFYWGVSASRRPWLLRTHSSCAVMTVAMAVYVFRYEIHDLRSFTSFMQQHKSDVQMYEMMFGDRVRVQEWTAGAGGGKDLAGWHCSWCVDVDAIRVTLTSARSGDFPRSGNYLAKLNTTDIERLIAKGVSLDGKSRLKRYGSFYAPSSLYMNQSRYLNLIHNVYENATNRHVQIFDLEGRGGKAKLEIRGKIQPGRRPAPHAHSRV